MTDPSPRRMRTPARYLAPVAMVVVAAIAVILVEHTTSGHSSSATAPPATTAVSAPRSHHHFWIVRPGQTLSLIAARTGVPVPRIEQLNPNLDPGALHSGQRIRVRP